MKTFRSTLSTALRFLLLAMIVSVTIVTSHAQGFGSNPGGGPEFEPGDEQCNLSGSPSINVSVYRNPGYYPSFTLQPPNYYFPWYFYTNQTYVAQLSGVDLAGLVQQGATFEWDVPNVYVEPMVDRPWIAKFWFTESSLTMSGARLLIRVGTCTHIVPIVVSNPTIWHTNLYYISPYHIMAGRFLSTSPGTQYEIPAGTYNRVGSIYGGAFIELSGTAVVKANEVVVFDDVNVLVKRQAGIPYYDNPSNPQITEGPGLSKIVVKSGATLEMKNVDLRPGENMFWGGIVLEAGATLILENVDIINAFAAIRQVGGPSTIIVRQLASYPAGTITLAGETQGTEPNNTASVRISNCVVGLDLVGLTSSSTVKYISVRSRPEGFIEPFNQQYGDYYWFDAPISTSPYEWKTTGYHTEAAFRFTRPGESGRTPQQVVPPLQAQHIRVDGAILGVEAGFSVLDFDWSVFTNIRKAAILQLTLGTPNYHNQISVSRSRIEVLRQDDPDKSPTWQEFKISYDWQGAGFPNTGDWYGRARRWGYYGRGAVIANFNTVEFVSGASFANNQQFTIGAHATGNFTAQGCTFNTLEKGVLTAPTTTNVVANIRENYFYNNGIGVWTGDGWETSLGSGVKFENHLIFKCNRFERPVSSYYSMHYGLYNIDQGLKLNLLSLAQPSLGQVPGGNVFPVPNSVTNRSVFPKNPSTGLRCNPIDLVGCGWGTLANWRSIKNTTTNGLMYARYTNEYTGTTEGTVSLNTLALEATNNGQQGVAPGAETCPNLGTTVYFPYLRVAADEAVTNEPKPILYPNPSNTGTFQIRDLKDEPIRIVNVLGQLQGFRQTGDLIQLTYPKAGIYQVFIGTQKATLKVE